MVCKTKRKKSKNPWMEHVNKVKMKNPKMKYKDVLVLAKKTYKGK